MSGNSVDLRTSNEVTEQFVWVVSGSTGEYADRNHWPVRAFLSEEKANKFRETLEAEYYGALAQTDHCMYELRDVIYRTTPGIAPDWQGNLKKLGIVSDPHFRVDYTGTSYYVEKIPLSEGTQ